MRKEKEFKEFLKIRGHSMVNVLFIIPPYFNAEDYLNNDRKAVLPAFTIPYGILCLDAYLKKHCEKNINIEILDLNILLHELVECQFKGEYTVKFEESILNMLKTCSPKFVCFSALFNSSAQYLAALCKITKEFNSEIITLTGGGLPSADYDKVLNTCPGLDAVCKGEGELPLKELLDAEDPWIIFDENKSWITAQGVKSGKIPEHTFLWDLDEIPFLDYSKIDLSFYNNRSLGKKDKGKDKREMSIHTSRGCPFKCVFCSNPSLHGYDVRFMSVARFISDIKRMKNDFGMTDLMLEDDHFFHDIKRAKLILKELAKIDIRVEFPNGLAVYAIDDEGSELISKAGVSAVALAVESGSDYVLNKIIKKPLRKKRIQPAIESLRKFNVRTHVFIVIGLPGETDEHRRETLNTLLVNEFDWVHVNVALPIAGSRLYDICIENGYIEDQTAENYIATKSLIRAPGIDPEKIEHFAYETQLLVNFVYNSNIKNKHYQIAIDYMKNVCEKYPQHALGHLYLSKCYKEIGESKLFQKHKILSDNLFSSDTDWKNFKDKYIDNGKGIPIDLHPKEEVDLAVEVITM